MKYSIFLLATILREKYFVPKDKAIQATQAYLTNFRLCPDNPEMHLDEWRHLLWAQALGEEFSKFAGAIYKQWLQLRYHYLAITPEVANLLKHLKRLNYRLGLITNGPSCAQWEKVRWLGLERMFDIILVSGDLPWEKPHENIFLEACRFLRVKPGNCIMIGDKLETDILGGKILGCTVWVAPPGTLSNGQHIHPRPDFTLNDVTELARLLPLTLSMPDIEDCNSNASDGS